MTEKNQEYCPPDAGSRNSWATGLLEVIELGLAPVGPVDDVVSGDEALAGTFGEAAAAIALPERPRDG